MSLKTDKQKDTFTSIYIKDIGVPLFDSYNLANHDSQSLTDVALRYKIDTVRLSAFQYYMLFPHSIFTLFIL
jgi:hypothetical protein